MVGGLNLIPLEEVATTGMGVPEVLMVVVGIGGVGCRIVGGGIHEIVGGCSGD